MNFSHALLTRPLEQSLELKDMLSEMGMDAVVQPAFDFIPIDAPAKQPEDFAELAKVGSCDLLIFTSPRAVQYGLGQFPADIPARARVAAIGPATAQCLAEAGIRVGIRAADGYTSEALLGAIEREMRTPESRAYILTAPGGRMKLASELRHMGYAVRMLEVYSSQPSVLDREALARLDNASRILSVWTSGNTMKALSQRLPPAAWFRVCQGDWLVISGRLARLARAFGPSGVHLAQGPGNQAITTAVRNLL